jgi:oxygen-dependent protoporphyrinogen oxidase
MTDLDDWFHRASPPDQGVVVVGGGIAGLTLAREISRSGRRVLILEAEAQPGGCVRSHTVGGLRLDRGAESFAAARPAARELIDELGLPVVAPNPGPAWVRHEAGTAPLPRGGLLGIPPDPAAPDVAAVIGRIGVWRARVDRLLPAGWGWSGGLGEVTRRRLGGRILRRLVDPVVGGVYSSDPEGLDVDVVAPGLRAAALDTGSLTGGVSRLRGGSGVAGSAVAGIDGGMAGLTDALADAVRSAGGAIRCQATVSDIRWTPGAGWTVTLGGPGSGRIQTPTVVLAVPPDAADRLLRGATDGAIGHPAAGRSAGVAIVTLVVRAPALDLAPRGSGVLVASQATGVRAKALTHATAKWAWLADAAGPGVHVLRLSYGRGASAGPPGRQGEPPDESAFPAVALADASELLGMPLTVAALIDSAVVRYRDTVPVFRAGQSEAVARMRADLARFPGLAVVGSGVSGTGLAAVIADARATAGTLHDAAAAG